MPVEIDRVQAQRGIEVRFAGAEPPQIIPAGASTPGTTIAATAFARARQRRRRSGSNSATSRWQWVSMSSMDRIV
jgi:hypothetical protein